MSKYQYKTLKLKGSGKKCLMGLILLWQISPFKHANVRSLKDKIDAFQTSFGSLQEAEGEAGLSHLGEAAQEGGSCKLIKYSDQ